MIDIDKDINERERAWALINLNNIRHNYLEIKKNTKSEILSIVKADGYGHGGAKIAEALLKVGARYFGVATFEEGLAIKNISLNNKNIKILILGFTPRDKLKSVIENNLEQTVFDFETAEKISHIATQIKKLACIHIKLDTGMHRLGFDCNDKKILEIINKINSLPNIIIAGIFSHFAQSDILNDKFTHEQYKKFACITKNLLDKRILSTKTLRHISNSCGLLNYPDYQLDMTRVGLLLYGVSPYDSQNKNILDLDLKPVMSLKSQIISIKEINTGESVSYNRKFIAQHKTKIAIVAIGYADGYPHCLANKAKVIINKQFAPVIGNICMDYMMIDLNNIKAKIGDAVTLIGTENNKSNNISISVNEIAQMSNTIPYEIMTSIGKRIPRYYIN